MNLATQNRENLPDYKQYISLGFTPKPEKKLRIHTKSAAFYKDAYTKVSWLEGNFFIGLPVRLPGKSN
jgi:hypothetical protein